MGEYTSGMRRLPLSTDLARFGIVCLGSLCCVVVHPGSLPLVNNGMVWIS